jgi:hypothetical protein
VTGRRSWGRHGAVQPVVDDGEAETDPQDPPATGDRVHSREHVGSRRERALLAVAGFVAAIALSRLASGVLHAKGAAGLPLDGFPLWLDLEDVHWQQQGRQSIEAACAFVALLALGLLVRPYDRRCGASADADQSPASFGGAGRPRSLAYSAIDLSMALIVAFTNAWSAPRIQS